MQLSQNLSNSYIFSHFTKYIPTQGKYLTLLKDWMYELSTYNIQFWPQLVKGRMGRLGLFLKHTTELYKIVHSYLQSTYLRLTGKGFNYHSFACTVRSFCLQADNMQIRQLHRAERSSFRIIHNRPEETVMGQKIVYGHE